MSTFTYPNTSGVIDLTPSALSSLGITLNPGDTLNIPAHNYSSIKGIGLNGSTGNPITINCVSGSHFNLTSYTFDNYLEDCSFIKFIGIDLLNCTHAVFHTIYGASHDITWQNCTFRNATDQHIIEVGANGAPKTFVGTKASTYYNFVWDTCTFSGSQYASFIIGKQGVMLDGEIKNCDFSNVVQPTDTQYPIPVQFHGYGFKIHDNVFHDIGTYGHMANIQFYGYADIYRNMFYDNWANDIRCFPLRLNFSTYVNGQNRFWNNISHDKRKYSMIEINTNNQHSLEIDASGYYLYNPNNFVYFNTLVRSYAETFQANLVDFFGADGTVKGNIILAPEIDKTYNSGRNYRVYNQDATYHTSTVVQSDNYQRSTVVTSDFDDTTWTPKVGGTLLDNMSEDIGFITTDFYNNPRKVGSFSDAGAVELQGGNISPTANAGSNITITLPTNSTTLNGSASSDPDGTIASYLWTKTSGPSTFTIVNNTLATTALTNLVQGTYIFNLLVTDNLGATNSDTVTVTVNAAGNVAPVANAGSDTTITLPVDFATLDGSGSTDSDGSIASYLWTKTSGPSTYTITNSALATTTVTGLVEGTYIFQLLVTDNLGDTDTDSKTIIVNPIDMPTTIIKISDLDPFNVDPSDGFIPIVISGVTKRIDASLIMRPPTHFPLSAFGAVGDGTTDDTVAIQAGLDYVSGTNQILLIDKPGTYIFDHLVVPNNSGIEGLGTQTILKVKTYGTQDKSIFTIADHTKHDFSISNLVIDGGVTYVGDGTLDSGSRVVDLTQIIFNFDYGTNLTFKNLTIKNTARPIRIFAAKNILVDNCIFQMVGLAGIDCGYSDDCDNIKVINSTFSTGYYNAFDSNVSNVRNGEVALQLGGRNILIEKCTFLNEAQHRWFYCEARLKENIIFRDNIFDGMGINMGGISLGGNFAGPGYDMLDGFTFSGNIFRNMPDLAFRTPQDQYLTGLNYLQGCYNEFSLMKNAKIIDNVFENSQMSFSFTIEDVLVRGNTWNNQALSSQRSGGNINFSIALVNNGTDTVKQLKFENNTFFFGTNPVKVMLIGNNGSPVDGLYFSNNIIISQDDLTILEMYKPSGGNNHKNLFFDNNFFSAVSAYKTIFYDNTAANTGFNYNFTNNDLSHIPIDRDSVILDFNLPSLFNFDGTRLRNGFTFNRVLQGTGSPEGVVNAPIGQTYINISGGANTTFYVKESGTGNTGWIAK